uniref:Uncharacterized protein n=1 Tax=Echinococcus canadensis TaxID=519352 RepID=A0A915F0T9_9CEST
MKRNDENLEILFPTNAKIQLQEQFYGIKIAIAFLCGFINAASEFSSRADESGSSDVQKI